MSPTCSNQPPPVPALPPREHWTGIAGGRLYPSRADYQSALAAAGRDLATADPAELASIQRHWHTSGQNGCPFAQWLAKRLPPEEWRTVVVDDPLAVDAAAVVAQVGNVVAQSSTSMVSILIPSETESGGAAAVVERLAGIRPFFLQSHESAAGYYTYQLRYQLDSGIVAWVMAFGPFPFMPATRRSPLFELVFRAREKPAWLYDRLNADHSIAHLADYPAPLKVTAWPRLFDFTLRETRRLLGCEPDHLTAAKMTLAIPEAQPA